MPLYFDSFIDTVHWMNLLENRAQKPNVILHVFYKLFALYRSSNCFFAISPRGVNCFEAKRLLSYLVLVRIPRDISVIDSSMEP